MKKQLRQPAYLLLLTVACVGLPMALFSAKYELQLPFTWYTNGLRLFYPEAMAEISDDIVKSANSGKDFALASYVNCVAAETEVGCAVKLEPALAQSPADGSIWLEYSKALAREGDAQVTAVEALGHSYDVSSHESWLIAARTHYVVSIWNGLTDELKLKAKADAALALPQYEFINILAKDYVAKPFAHAAIQELLDQATPQQKIQFLNIVKSAAN
jgi:hypothetical protein